MVTYAQTPEEDGYVKEAEQEVNHFGFKNVLVVNMQNPADIDTLGDFDVIYVCGGNTFAILNKLRETGLDAFIINQIKSRAIYVGVSAGSIIAGPDIETAGWGVSGDPNKIGMKDFKAFGLTDIIISPHFQEERRGEIEEWREKIKNRIIEITDDQAVWVENGLPKLLTP